MSKTTYLECSFKWNPKLVINGPKFAQLNVYFPPGAKADTKVQLIPVAEGFTKIGLDVSQSVHSIYATLTTQENWGGEPVTELLASPIIPLKRKTRCQVTLELPLTLAKGSLVGIDDESNSNI